MPESPLPPPAFSCLGRLRLLALLGLVGRMRLVGRRRGLGRLLPQGSCPGQRRRLTPQRKRGKRGGSGRKARLRPGTPISLEDAVRIVGRYVEHYNHVRLHSAIGYFAPAHKLAGRETDIFTARDRKLAEARERRKAQRDRRRLQAVA